MTFSTRRLTPLAALFLMLPLLLLPGGCAGEKQKPPTQVQRLPLVRVRVLQDADRVTLTASGPVLLRESSGKVTKLAMTSGAPVVVTRLPGGGWQLVPGQPQQAGAPTIEVPGGVVELFPTVDGDLAMDGTPYRGAYRLVPGEAGRFDVVNDVDVERYLMGVVSKEVLPGWHIEAFRAQAVVARTYALYEAATNPAGRTWDLYPDERSQVYGGVNGESPKSIEAVNTTRGQVVAYGSKGKERIFRAYFSSCCGGVGQAAGDAFGGETIPPLAAKSVGPRCAESPRFEWGPIVLTKVELARRLRAYGARTSGPLAKLPGLARLEVADLNPFGRPRRFLVTDTAGVQYSLDAEAMRRAINCDAQGGVVVYSGYFTPVDAGDAVRLTDCHGWGHGVGMCQWCAQAQAQAGDDYRKIVLDAFPTAKILLAY